MDISWEQNQERAGFIHEAEANMSLIAPELHFNPADLFGFVAAAWTPNCHWDPIDAAAEFATSILAARDAV